MNFTAKEDYGLRAALDLALHAGGGPAQTREIAARQRVAAGPARACHGQSGAPRALGTLVPTEMVDGDPATWELPEAQVIRGVWMALRQAIRDFTDDTTLQDLLGRRSETVRGVSYMMHI